MFPVTTQVVIADHSRRLESYRRWSQRHGQIAGVDANDAPRPVSGHRRTLRAAFSW